MSSLSPRTAESCPSTTCEWFKRSHFRFTIHLLIILLVLFLTVSEIFNPIPPYSLLPTSYRKQCIESEKLFDFLKELAEQASGSSTDKESKAKGNCLGHRYISSFQHCIVLPDHIACIISQHTLISNALEMIC